MALRLIRSCVSSNHLISTIKGNGAIDKHVHKIPVTNPELLHDILITEDNLEQLIAIINERKLHRNIFLAVDSNVRRLYETTFNSLLNEEFDKVLVHTISEGEESKTFPVIQHMYSTLLDNQFGRDTLIIAAGGGVTGDAAGFAAATYMRGVQLVHLPTTVLAAVDSSIGGKSGVNFYGRKNIVGAFHQPEFVFIDTSFYQTLPKAELTSGLGEIIKYGFLSDTQFYDYIRDNINEYYRLDKDFINSVVFHSARLKADIVCQDVKETGTRKLLNLGHTFAHAMEPELDFAVSHGEAVIAGIIAALFLSVNLGLLAEDDAEKLLDLPLRIPLDTSFKNICFDNVYHNMFSDKKNRNGKLQFVLPLSIGETAINVEAPREQVYSALESMLRTIS